MNTVGKRLIGFAARFASGVGNAIGWMCGTLVGSWDDSMTGGMLGFEVGLSEARTTMTGGWVVSEEGLTVPGGLLGPALGSFLVPTIITGGAVGGEIGIAVASSVGLAVSGGGIPRTRNDMSVDESLIWSTTIPVC